VSVYITTKMMKELRGLGYYYFAGVNRQLGRRVGAFDKDVYTETVKILSKLLVENGNSED
jgi:hypothetical protein